MRTAWFVKNKFIIVLFFAAFTFRLSISSLGFHDDIFSNTAWGEWIYRNGPRGFYESRGWILSSPTQPPLISLLYGFNHFLYDKLMYLFANMGIFIATFRLIPTKMIWFFDFSLWFSNTMYGLTPFKFGALVSMKIVAIIADLLIAFIIYQLAKNKVRLPALWSAAYLFSPFSWYLSALWGQYDQAGFLFLLLAIISLSKRYLVLTPLLLLVSLELKPTALVFIPLFLWIYFRQRPTVRQFVLGLSFSVVVFILSIWLFTNRDLVNFIQGELIPRIFLKSAFRVSTNAFNFWRIIIGNAARSDEILILFIPAKIWGYVAFLFLNIYAFKICKEITLENIIKSVFIIGAGSFLFMTNMLDRYFFAGIASLLIITIYQNNLFKYWLILSFIFWLNLFNHWWFPVNIDFLKQILIWQDFFISRVLALINVLIFLLLASKMIMTSSKKVEVQLK